MYVIDTNVVSELRKTKSGHADKAVVRWIETIPSSSTFLSVVTVYEIKSGILKLAKRNPLDAGRLDEWLSHAVISSFAGRILPFDEQVALKLAEMMTIRTYPYRDGIIAATAQHHGYTLVTRNVRDFQGLPVTIINPWDFT